MSEGHSPPSGTILQTVADYYAERLRRFGTTPRGVDWSSADSQLLRFERLLQVAQDSGDASVNDYGCGYGALVDYLVATGRPFSYRGFDVCESMIQAARARHAGVARCSFTPQRSELASADYTVASGIFNVTLGHADDAWHDYVVQTLTAMAAVSSRGFAFNMLSTYSDPPKRRRDLFYGDPTRMFDLCKRRFSSRVALLHDYPLYEFTIIVRM
jgi:SAM-dependent methyltransferase